MGLRDAIENADMVATWYGKGFDWKFLNSRLLTHGHRVMNRIWHVDLCIQAARQLAFHSSRLDAFAKWVGLPVQKTPLLPVVWQKAAMGDGDSVRLVMEHCEADTLITRAIFPYIKRAVRAVSL